MAANLLAPYMLCKRDSIVLHRQACSPDDVGPLDVGEREGTSSVPIQQGLAQHALPCHLALCVHPQTDQLSSECLSPEHTYAFEVHNYTIPQDLSTHVTVQLQSGKREQQSL